jgi:DNA-binding response OmpR family regulator
MPRIPIVMITADSTDQSRKTAIDAGVDEYMVKPIAYEDLEAVIQRVVK